MFSSNTDKDWEKFGKNDPYYGVVTHEAYRKENLTRNNLECFFKSGQEHIERVIDVLRPCIEPDQRIERAMDFGCGVGRMLIPLSKIADHVTGADVSESMLKEAEKNCLKHSIKNVELIRSDDNLSALKGQFDLIHSFIVFQHIPVKRGLTIFENLIDHLKPGGLMAVHFTYAASKKYYNLIWLMRKYIPLAKNLINVVKGRSFNAPQMQMNQYDPKKVYDIINLHGLKIINTEPTDHSGHLGVILYLRK